MNIVEYGYDIFFKKQFDKKELKELIPARIISESRNSYSIVSEQGFFIAKLIGKVRQDSIFRSDLPAVGDWVAVSIRRDNALIHKILDRRSVIIRKTSGKIFDQQILSSNIDILFIVTSPDNDFNINRLERYISLAESGKVRPVILLNKMDTLEDPSFFIEMTKNSFLSVDVRATSIKDPEVKKMLEKYLSRGKTGAFVGSSGVGKSSLINILIGRDLQKTGAISDSVKKGKHTTSKRELILLENGGMVIDTPGIRELQVWDENASSGFKDIEELAKNCRFSDCMHDTEPECAVKTAVENGLILQERIDKWKSLKLEIEEMKKNREFAAKIIAKRRKALKK
jgi:ribosome biogenesis GTPase / thiamine phosphate phosphatase